MTAVVGSAISPADPGGAASAPFASTASAGDLLPAPGAGVAYGSELAGVYELLSQARGAGVALGQAGVEQDRALQARAFADENAAIAREEANQRGSGGGLLDSVSRLVSDVVADVLHGQGAAAVRDAGGDLDSAWNSPHFWSDLERGLSDVAAFSSEVGAVAGIVGGPVGAVVKVIAQGVVTGADVGVAIASARGEAFAASAEDAHADVVWSKSAVERLERDVGTLLDDVKSNDAALGQALGGAAAAISTSGRTLVSSTAQKG